MKIRLEPTNHLSMFIPEDLVQQIKDKVRLEEVIQRFAILKKKGSSLEGECPFCNVKKFSLSPAKQIYKCWSCEKGGNSSIQFIMDKENLDYPAALKWLADFYNFIIPEADQPPPKQNKKKAKKDAKEPDPAAGEGTGEPKVSRYHGDFYKSTMRSIGLSNDQNKVLVKWLNKSSQSETVPLLTEDAAGNIEFLVYDINGFVVTYNKNGKEVPYKVIRLKEPLLNSKDGKMMKYIIPKGVGTRPFFPPGLMQKFHDGTKISTLFLTEGYKKSISGWVNGLDIVGLTSISTYRDKETLQIHRDIVDLILRCKIENVVLLYDGDCANISLKAFEEKKDISIRPKNFFSSASGIKELLKDYLKDHEIALYFAHINSESVEGNPKGLDDIYDAMLKVQHRELVKALPEKESSNIAKGRLLIEAKKLTRQILNMDLMAFSKPGVYFTKINITFGLKKLEQHLALENATNFYLRHQEVIKERQFIYFGTQYKYNVEKGECEVIIPAASKNYARVGDDYYEKVPVPNKYKELEMQLHRRAKTTIGDDHGKNFINHIAKYKAFCNVPDHTNYQEVIHNCFNMYSRFEWEPDEGDCQMTLDFIRHIFEEHYELGLDYLQLMYQRPQQILPILCLVSKANNTGKSTFAKWLKQIFRNNMAIVGNADLANDFNGFWSTKLIICCDEAFIEKKVIVERIKSLSTADRITMNQKGRDQVEIEFFGKFIMLTNNEENFIYATEDDIRYWVRKIKTPRSLVVNLERELIAEIPAFLHFLNNRSMHSTCESRMWFAPKDIVTDALRKVVMSSRSTLEKELRTKLQSMFEDFSENIITMSVTDIRKEFFNNRYEEKYVLEILRDQMKVEQWWEPGENGNKIFKVKRYSYPKWHSEWTNGSQSTNRIEVRANGRPFVFLRPDYVPVERELILQHDPEFLLIATAVPPHYKKPGMIEEGQLPAPVSSNGYHPVTSELPFS